MTITEAQNILQNLFGKEPLTEDEEFMYIEALEYLINETHDPDYMVELGGYYYEMKKFDLAEKYYELADEYGHPWAPEGLGYIWYYGRTGVKDYEKAFKYYSKASENGYPRSTMKVADMYKNGFYVEQDYDKYCEIIEDLSKKYRIATDGVNPMAADVAIRLGRIRKKQGRTEEAIELFMQARSAVTQRLEMNPFFGDLTVMKWVTGDLYSLIEVDTADLTLYDLYEVLRKPAKVEFMFLDEKHEVESVLEDAGDEEIMAVRFDDKWYRSVDDFFAKATIDGERLPCLYWELSAFRIV